MKATNLAISIPYKGCDKNCPYCVSKMTGYNISKENVFKRNRPKVRNLARNASIASVLLTGKGEPLLNIPSVLDNLNYFQDFPLELQTNGIYLKNNFNKTSILHNLYDNGLDCIAFSLDRISTFQQYNSLFKSIVDMNMTVRVTLNVTDLIAEGTTFHDIVSCAIENHVEQLSLRRVTIPNYIDLQKTETAKSASWIKKHVEDKHHTEELITDMINTVASSKDAQFLRALPYGAKVYDYRGISVTYFDYCVQDSNDINDIRSLIFEEDGHLYTSWNSRASKIF